MAARCESRVVNHRDIYIYTYNWPAGPISIKCRGTPVTKKPNRIIGIVLPYRRFHLRRK